MHKKLIDWMTEDLQYISKPERRRIEKILILIWSLGIPILLFGYFVDLFSLFVIGVIFIMAPVVFVVRLFPKNTFDYATLVALALGMGLFLLSVFEVLALGEYQGIETSKLFAFVLLGIGIIMVNERDKSHPVQSTIISMTSIIVVIHMVISFNENLSHFLTDLIGEDGYFFSLLIFLFLLIVVKVIWKKE